MTAPLVLILSSPSGGGKNSIARALLASGNDVGYAVSATTRDPRPGEHDGQDYHFVSPEEFDRRVKAGEFAEWETYAGERYGTLNAELDRLRAAGRHAVLDLEVRGARRLRATRPDAVTVFVLPPDIATLVDRLGGRATEPPEVRESRLAIALEELHAVPEYDYVVVNDVLERAVEDIRAIIRSEGRRPRHLPGLREQMAALTAELEARVPAARGRHNDRGSA